jgi:hypothetical protein
MPAHVGQDDAEVDIPVGQGALDSVITGGCGPRAGQFAKRKRFVRRPSRAMMGVLRTARGNRIERIGGGGGVGVATAAS